MTAERPQFCPWCGTPIGYEAHDHDPRWRLLAERARGEGAEPPELPERVRETLAGESYVGACAGCRTITHVIGHRARS